MNQCDGCMRGLPIDEYGMHRGPQKNQPAMSSLPWHIDRWIRSWNQDVQLCTKDRYPSPTTEPRE